jgi:hypothetical protein
MEGTKIRIHPPLPLIPLSLSLYLYLNLCLSHYLS